MLLQKQGIRLIVSWRTAANNEDPTSSSCFAFESARNQPPARSLRRRRQQTVRSCTQTLLPDRPYRRHRKEPFIGKASHGKASRGKLSHGLCGTGSPSDCLS